MTGIYWKPVESSKGQLSDQLRAAITKRFDPPLIFQDGVTWDLAYIQGLVDAGVEDAATLLHLVQTYGKIELTVE